MLKKYQIADGRMVESPDGESQVLVFFNPDESEKRYLIDELKVDEHTLHSSLDPDELSRLEFEPNHLALIFKGPRNYSAQDQFLFKVASTGLFLFKDRLVVVAAGEMTLFEGKQFTKVASLPHLMLRLIYASILHFFGHLKIINMISDELEDKVTASMENKFLLNMFTLEKSLVYYLNAINSNGVLIERLRNNAAKIGFTPLETELLDDIHIENTQCYRQADIYSNILSSMMDARVSIVSNNLNILMKTLNIITIMIMVPTFVVSAFSMNVHIPISSHPFAFWIIIGMALVSVMSFMFYWRYKRW